uniref:Uncharacterized protein n=1 Tax=Udotea flabellum TaxID=170437 RepID=A0A386B1T8_9CHLO|nr:hypothetical protein [Udotea flabellum]AYC65674.1 hypothetical protein [Udotea flabellum]
MEIIFERLSLSLLPLPCPYGAGTAYLACLPAEGKGAVLPPCGVPYGHIGGSKDSAQRVPAPYPSPDLACLPAEGKGRQKVSDRVPAPYGVLRAGLSLLPPCLPQEGKQGKRYLPPMCACLPQEGKQGKGRATGEG